MIAKEHRTWILVGDGARARILESAGPGTGLTVLSAEEHPESRQRTRELGDDKPGRGFESADASRHGMAPPVDWQRFEKEKFATALADILNKAAAEKRFDALVVVAPPKTLGDLRGHLNAHAKELVTGEINKDLTNAGEGELASHLGGFVNL